MPLSYSPLRYPGGETSIYELVSDIINANKLQRRHYAEPYAGGCGLALALLFNGRVSDIHINDIDLGIWSFWHSVLNHTDELVEKIKRTSITISEWEYQREVKREADPSDHVTLGFATFFLDRTNRSGIIKNAGVIGGRDQTGNYKIDCRFNKEDLIRRIRRIEKYKNRIHLSTQDALNFMHTCELDLPDELFFVLIHHISIKDQACIQISIIRKIIPR